uniref:FYVE, RhoGEF and PH domain-containing protein 5-like n=1 Tax=Seriola lalandi dorsalis TaxID=1841481 RepID=A0A3B4ZC56_SERLL
MSAARGPKPSIAPKPKVAPELNGNQGGCGNGGLLISDGEVDDEHETKNGPNNVIKGEEQFTAHVVKSPRKDLQNVSQGPEDGEVTEEEKEEEEDMIQKMDEDWRLTDSALTEEVDSLETLWVSDAGLTADSEEVVEMIDTDMTEDMDADGCDAGEALADTDGLSVGDIFVNSIDEEAGCSSAENRDMKKRQEKLSIKEDETGDCTADDLTESFTDEPGIPISENTKDTDTQQVFLSDGEEKEEESVSDCGITCSILKLRCGHKMKEKGENIQNISFYDFIPEEQKQRHVALEDDPIHEPYYVSSEDIINREMMPRNNKAQGLPNSPRTPQKLFSLNSSGVSAGNYEETGKNGQIVCVSSEDYVEIGHNNEYSCNSGDEKKVGRCQKRTSFRTEEHKARTAEALLNHFDYQPRFRLVSISVPTDTDTSLTSSLSESQLLSPNDSDVFRDEDDLEGHIVPFLDDTTDTEQDISDEHVYEEPGHSSEGENVFPFDRKATGMQSRSLSHRINNNVAEMGVQFVQRPYMSGFGQPALSSSPMLNSVRHKSYSKPHYLSLYPRSLSMEGQDMPQRQREAICSSGSFSRCSPLPSSGLSTPTSVVDIPPPFELAYITKRPITKSSPSLLIEGDSSEKNRKKKSSLKRFLMLKFRRKTESKSVVDVNPSSFKSSADSSHHTPSRLLDLDTHSLNNSPQLNSRSAGKPQVSSEPASALLFYNESNRKGNSVAFLNRSVVRVESFEDRSRVPFIPLPLTKPRSISFPNTDTSDYENVPPISSDYENLQVPQRRPVRQGPFADFFDRPSRMLSSANDTDGYVDMSSLPGFRSKAQSPEEETERYVNKTKNLQRIADIFLSRKAEFLVFTTYIGHYDRSMSLLEDSCRTSPAFAAIVHQFEVSGFILDSYGELINFIPPIDYLNNLSPDSKEYEDTQGTVNKQQTQCGHRLLTLLSVTHRRALLASVRHCENLLRLVNIEYSVHGQRDLLQPGRVFVKEGTLMKVSRKSRQPRHLFLMNDVLLYTYPQQDGKYRLKNTLPLTGLKVSKPITENVQNALKIEGTDISITLSARWVTLYCARDRLHLSLGEKAPTLVPVSQVMMCMNCTSDFSLTLRRHHCHGCGRIVCRSCSRNRYPLKYMKDRMAKVCDHCYNELKKRGGETLLSSNNLTVSLSPRPNRSSRPLSAVFQNIHPPNIWRHRKGTMSFNQVTETEEGSISGSLQRTKKSKRNWKRLWFLLKDKVLYTYRAQEEKVASESLPLLGFTVKLPDKQEGEDEASVFQLYHKNTLYYTFKAEDNYTAQRWANAMEEATVL